MIISRNGSGYEASPGDVLAYLDKLAKERNYLDSLGLYHVKSFALESLPDEHGISLPLAQIAAHVMDYYSKLPEDNPLLSRFPRALTMRKYEYLLSCALDGRFVW